MQHLPLLLPLLLLTLASCDLFTSGEEEELIICGSWIVPMPKEDCLIHWYEDIDLDWSPDGRYIAFTVPDTVSIKLNLYDLETGSETVLLEGPGNTHGPSWSPDGRWLAFGMYGQIWKLALGSDSLVQLTNGGENFFPDWSPDGGWIAYDNTDCGHDIDSAPPDACGVLIMRSDGSEKQKVGIGRYPTWHPSGESLLITRDISPYSAESRFMRHWPFASQPVDTLVAVRDDENSYPMYSPDGRQIAFQSQNSKTGHIEVYVMPSRGDNPRQLTTEGGSHPTWSPDGRRLAYTNVAEGDGHIWIMNADGSGKRPMRQGTPASATGRTTRPAREVVPMRMP